MRTTRGRLLVSTNAVGNPAAEFAFRFLWRAAKDVRSSNEAPSIVAADAGAAREALLAAMTGSYSTQAMNRVVAESPTNAAKNCWEIYFPWPHTDVSLARQFRVARRLVASRLEATKMMSPYDGTWPPDFRPEKMLALYDAEGASYYGSELLDRVVDETTLDSRTLAVCPEDVREGILDRCTGVLFPGGPGGRKIARALQPEGIQRVRDFVAKGGGYFGVCAGAYLATSGLPEYSGMMPLKHDSPADKGNGKLKFSLTPEGEAMLGQEYSQFETGYHCGPVFCDLTNAHVTVLAHFDMPATDENGVVRQEMVGTPAILCMEWQKGKIMIISPHPEGQSKHSPLVARAIGWTIGQDPKSIRFRVPHTAENGTTEAAKNERNHEPESAGTKQP